MHRVTLAVIALAVTPLHAVSAQSRSPVRPGSSIRLSTRDGAIHQGRLLERRGDTLVLDRSGDRVPVFVGSVESMWVRGTAAKTGAIVGAVPFALLGSYVSVVMSAHCEEGRQERMIFEDMYSASDPCLPVELSVLFGGMAGAAVGALLGGGIGAVIPKWHRRSPPRGFRVSLGPRGAGRFGFDASISF